MPTIQREIRLAPRIKYRGASVIRAGDDEARHLLPLGWRTVHITRDYTYLLPPTSHHGRAVTLTLTIPDRPTIETLAFQLHAEGKPYRGELDGWPVRYDPREEGTRRWRITPWGEPSRIEERPYVDPATSEVGDRIWSVGARWEDGNTAPPRWYGA